jgi:hypothetical protein
MYIPYIPDKIQSSGHPTIFCQHILPPPGGPAETPWATQTPGNASHGRWVKECHKLFHVALTLDDWMTGWLDGWMAGCLDDWMTGWLDDWMTGWLDHWITGWWWWWWMGLWISICTCYLRSFEARVLIRRVFWSPKSRELQATGASWDTEEKTIELDGLMPKHGQCLCFRRFQILTNTHQTFYSLLPNKMAVQNYIHSVRLKSVHTQVCRSSGRFQPPTYYNGHLVTIIPFGRMEVEWKSSLNKQLTK